MRKFFKYTQKQLDKLGNTLIYLSNHINDLSRAKALKLVYILDETSIKENGIPFLNLPYHLWKHGPVDAELFAELSNENLFLLKDYIVKQQSNIKALKPFDDNEFSGSDIKLMDKIIKTFGSKTAEELSAYTKREHSVWYDTAKSNGVLNDLLAEKMSTTDILIDINKVVGRSKIRTNPHKKGKSRLEAIRQYQGCFIIHDLEAVLK